PAPVELEAATEAAAEDDVEIEVDDATVVAVVDPAVAPPALVLGTALVPPAPPSSGPLAPQANAVATTAASAMKCFMARASRPSTRAFDRSLLRIPRGLAPARTAPPRGRDNRDPVARCRWH